SDTRRLWDVGAEQVALVAPDRIALSRRLRVELTLQEVLESVVTVGTESPTLVLVEGYKRSRVPKIEVIRAACNPQPLQDLEHRLACVTDVSGLTLDCPMLALNDVAGVVELLLSYAEGGA
ncbi:MAG: molybdopterin-guanine dinucleotide biosynthesis protein MobB, partial [Anaerolineae bacterium]|nr:molybdopterin-guanine dinucleotide biosynthesis protein MobB [Anaerolineae bacterium]